MPTNNWQATFITKNLAILRNFDCWSLKLDAYQKWNESDAILHERF